MILVENDRIQRNELVSFVALSHFQVTFSTATTVTVRMARGMTGKKLLLFSKHMKFTE